MLYECWKCYSHAFSARFTNILINSSFFRKGQNCWCGVKAPNINANVYIFTKRLTSKILDRIHLSLALTIATFNRPREQSQSRFFFFARHLTRQFDARAAFCRDKKIIVELLSYGMWFFLLKYAIFVERIFFYTPASLHSMYDVVFRMFHRKKFNHFCIWVKFQFFTLFLFVRSASYFAYLLHLHSFLYAIF